MIEIAPGYIVCTDGRILSFWKRGVKTPSNSSYKELKPSTDTKGYLGLTICINKKKIKKRVHRLVAETYLENPDNLPCVRHVDGNKLNNRVENLAWSDYYENEHDKKNHGTYDKRLGGRKLSDHDLKLIREYLINGYDQTLLALRFNISRPTINRIANNKIWRE